MIRCFAGRVTEDAMGQGKRGVSARWRLEAGEGERAARQRRGEGCRESEVE